MSLFAVLYTDGLVELTSIKNECKKENWAPIFVYEQGKDIIVPCFTSQEDARKFGKKNLPKEWLSGAVSLSEREYFWLKSQKYIIEVMNYPRKIKDLYKTGFRILEFSENPDVHYV